jgi:hypothetical protein
MSKLLLSASLILFSVFATAQTGFKIEELNHVWPVPDTMEFEQVLATHMKNTSNATTTYRWTRTTLCTDPNYGNSVCIGSLCYEQTENTRTFTLAPGDSTELSMHLWKNGPGNATASIEVRIHPENNPANVALLTFQYGVCTSLTTEPGGYAALEIYPNPASQYLKLDHVEDAASAEIFDQSGALVLTHDLTQGSTIDLSALRTGTFVVRVSDRTGSKTTVKAFTKQ